MRSPIEIETRLRAGSVIHAMPPELAIITLTLLRKLYVPTTLTLILDQANMKRSTLRISYEYLPDLISELLT